VNRFLLADKSNLHDIVLDFLNRYLEVVVETVDACIVGDDETVGGAFFELAEEQWRWILWSTNIQF